MESSQKQTLLNAGTVAAAVGASLCCILPVAVAVLGVGSAALGAQLEPWRPYLTALTVLLLSGAFYQAYRRPKCEPSEVCAAPQSRRRSRLVLWGVALLAALLLAFPYYVSWLI